MSLGALAAGAREANAAALSFWPWLLRFARFFGSPFNYKTSGLWVLKSLLELLGVTGVLTALLGVASDFTCSLAWLQGPTPGLLCMDRVCLFPTWLEPQTRLVSGKCGRRQNSQREASTFKNSGPKAHIVFFEEGQKGLPAF